MRIEKVHLVYFSGTGTTQTTARQIGSALAAGLDLPVQEIDFTPAPNREPVYAFSKTDFVLFASPVYAGRIPNVLLSFVRDHIRGDHTPCAVTVLYGNRNYDSALAEWSEELRKNRFLPIGAAAFIGEHSFSRTLGAGRPNPQDLIEAAAFGTALATKLQSSDTAPESLLPIEVPVQPYYVPRRADGTRINILKVKPKVSESCTNCGTCVRLCPMGSIDPADVSLYTGICIKCSACIKKCPAHARFFDDPDLLYHKEDLENVCHEPKQPQTWL